MTSLKQTQANRKNAQKSTGPKTVEGKAVVSLNAVKHGLLSRKILLSDEKKAELDEFGRRIRSQLQPVGEMENYLVDRIISAAWRLRRVLEVEAKIFNRERFDYPGEDEGLGLAWIRAAQKPDAFSKLSRYETTIERGLYKALHELQRLQATREGKDAPLPAAVDVDISMDGKETP